ncbi:MAG: hypothetical protein E7384_04955 [Ruminococcaceae bacterium]|nr:hypothetical protein [Oscillospiraceae bacterium]
MFDKKQEKIKKHFDIYIDGKKFKIMNFFITETPDKWLRLVTKIRGQQFPRKTVAEIIITTPDDNISLHGCFMHNVSSPACEEWCYEIV